MSRIVSLALIVLTFSFIGCATKPMTIEEAKPITVKNQFKFHKKTKKRNALLSFVRNNSFLGSACETRILINGKKVGEVGTGKIIKIYLKPGKYKVGIIPTNIKICGGKLQEKTVFLKRNSEDYYRLGYVQSIDMTPLQKQINEEDL